MESWLTGPWDGEIEQKKKKKEKTLMDMDNSVVNPAGRKISGKVGQGMG